MAVFHAFRALRPTPEKAADVAALPYDVVNREEAKSIGDENPLSFLHIDRPEMDLEPETDLYDDRVYEKAKENLDNMEEKGILVQDQKACYYIYELVRKGKTQTGIVGCSSIDDYMNGVVKKHELTREDKEQDRIHHVDSCNANTGPIFLACRYPDSLLTLMNNWKDHHEAAYDFTEEDQITHRVWVIDEDEVISEINKEFAGIDFLYIADGHHRAASAVKVGLKRREQNPGYTGEEEFNYFLSVVFPYDQLCILPYNRIVKDLNGLTVKAFLYIVITADKGLAGAYNHNVIKMAHELFEQGENNKLFVVGELGRQYFTKEGLEVDTEFKYTVQNPSLHRARVITERILELYNNLLDLQF